MKQQGYEIGILGERKGKCCGEWCLDCDFIRRNMPEFKEKFKKKYGNLVTTKRIAAS